MRPYLHGAVAYLDVVRQERLVFPGGLYFDVPAGARAVYVGTVRYHRNDFNRITRVEVIDERDDVSALPGTPAERAQVVPALLKPVDGLR
ncbi:hypothetical protein [Ramlibacter humi]|uniref:hypothetical protein n=1 Tax=Ramlibacter humi TaxID=2530451 RepID=UPI00197D1E2C|nr:hypothetical protein [Ramlibacter humi]